MKDVAARDPARFARGILCIAAVLFPSAVNAEVTDELLEKFQPAQYESADGETISYRLMTPATQKDNTKYPLVLFLHGAGERGDDNVVPISRAREMVVALTKAGHSPELRYVEYPKVGHNSWTRTFQRDDLFRWLFAQHRQ